MSESVGTVLERNLGSIKNVNQAPSPYELRERLLKQGMSVTLRVVMRTLQEIMENNPNLKELIGAIFNKVSDPRDLNYRFGECQCNTCRFGILVLFKEFNLLPNKTSLYRES